MLVYVKRIMAYAQGRIYRKCMGKTLQLFLKNWPFNWTWNLILGWQNFCALHATRCKILNIFHILCLFLYLYILWLISVFIINFIFQTQCLYLVVIRPTTCVWSVKWGHVIFYFYLADICIAVKPVEIKSVSVMSVNRK